MAHSYDDMQGDPTDSQDHVATNMPQANQHYAGDVITLPILGQANTGPTPNSAPYAVGKETDPKVKSIGDNALRSWYGSMKSR